MEQRMRIKIEFSEDALFGALNAEGYDVAESMRAFRAELMSFVYDAYPHADITIEAGDRDRIAVNGRADHPEVVWIQQLIERVWNDQPWEVPSAKAVQTYNEKED
jgi:hypothetical protein